MKNSQKDRFKVVKFLLLCPVGSEVKINFSAGYADKHNSIHFRGNRGVIVPCRRKNMIKIDYACGGAPGCCIQFVHIDNAVKYITPAT